MSEGARIAIIVPFRDLTATKERSVQLRKFIPYMEEYLKSSEDIAAFKVFVIEQSDDGRKFNRGKLLNIGYLFARQEGYDTFIFHDVDLLPQRSLLPWYSKRVPPGEISHIGRCWSRYNTNLKYLGGIVAIGAEAFERMDGFPNTYWGWGGEDDEFAQRVEDKNITIVGPPRELSDGIVDLEDMSLDEKLTWLRANRDTKCAVKWEVNDAHEEVRSYDPKPKWFGLQGIDISSIEVMKRYVVDNHETITLDVGWNFEDDGAEHWTNKGLLPTSTE